MEEEEKKQNIVSIYPNPLYMIQAQSSDNLISQISVKNLTNDYVVFKIKLGSKDINIYKLSPSESFIPPKGTTTVEVKRYKREDKPNEYQGIMQFSCYTINKVINNNSEAKEAISSKYYNEKSGIKIEVKIFIIEDENEYNDNIDVVEDYGDNAKEGIKRYIHANKNLNIKSNIINKKIKELEERIKMINNQKDIQNEKRKAIVVEEKDSGESDFNKIILLCVILFGLLVGANFARGFNRIFYG